jgi:hypothetical protein
MNKINPKRQESIDRTFKLFEAVMQNATDRQLELMDSVKEWYEKHGNISNRQKGMIESILRECRQ